MFSYETMTEINDYLAMKIFNWDIRYIGRLGQWIWPGVGGKLGRASGFFRTELTTDFNKPNDNFWDPCNKIADIFLAIIMAKEKGIIEGYGICSRGNNPNDKYVWIKKGTTKSKQFSIDTEVSFILSQLLKEVLELGDVK